MCIMLNASDATDRQKGAPFREPESRCPALALAGGDDIHPVSFPASGSRQESLGSFPVLCAWGRAQYLFAWNVANSFGGVVACG